MPARFACATPIAVNPRISAMWETVIELTRRLIVLNYVLTPLCIEVPGSLRPFRTTRLDFIEHLVRDPNRFEHCLVGNAPPLSRR